MTTPVLPSPELFQKQQFFVPSLTAGLYYPLDSCAAFDYSIVSVSGMTDSGSVTADIQVYDGTSWSSISGLSSVSLSTTFATTTVAAANTVSPGYRLRVHFPSATSPQNIQFTLVAVRLDPTGGFINKFCNPSMNIKRCL